MSGQHVKVCEHTLKSQRHGGKELALYCVSFLPSSPQANLIWAHGFGEHVGRYFGGASRLLKLSSFNSETPPPEMPLYLHISGVHGISVWAQMAENGIAVHTFDAHGHGRSQPREAEERAMIWRFEDLVMTCFITSP